MPDLQQIQRQIDNLNRQKDVHEKKIQTLRMTLEKEQKLKDGVQEKIDSLTGNVEESDGAITTTTAGNISVAGGQGNYAPKMGMKSRNGFTKQSMFNKKKNEGTIIDYLDGVFE